TLRHGRFCICLKSDDSRQIAPLPEMLQIKCLQNTLGCQPFGRPLSFQPSWGSHKKYPNAILQCRCSFRPPTNNLQPVGYSTLCPSSLSNRFLEAGEFYQRFAISDNSSECLRRYVLPKLMFT